MPWHPFMSLLSRTLLTLHILSTVCTGLKCPEQCECRKTIDPKLHSSPLISHCEVGGIKSARFWPENTTALFVYCRGDVFDPASLEPQMFQKLPALTSLVFSQCDFPHRNKEIPISFNYSEELYISKAVNFTIYPEIIFHLFRHIRSLKIIQSNWERSSHDSLCVLKNITNLVLIRNGIRNFSDVLKLCSQKQSIFHQLTLFIFEYNEIEIIRSGCFKKFQNLRFLKLTGNRIEEIQNGSIVNLPQLQFLDVSSNYLQKLPNDFAAGCPQLGYLGFSNNPIKEIPQEVITGLSKLNVINATNTLLSDISSLVNMSLKVLYAGNSSLRWIPSPFCRRYSVLKIVNLRQNQIHEIPMNVFGQCSSLTFLDLSYNDIEGLHGKSFNGLGSLKFLSLSKNKIAFVSGRAFTSLYNLLRLNMSFNWLKAVPSLPTNVLEADLSRNKIQQIILKTNTRYRIKNLYLDNNRIETITDFTFIYCESIVKLHLKNNRLKTLKMLAFYGLKNLYEIDIADNNIEDVGSVLILLESLVELHIQYNRLSSLKKHTFPSSIQKVNLSNNKIKTIEEGTFENLKDLEMVDLRWNELVSLDSSSMKLNPNIMAVTTFSVLGNPLKCDCHLASLKNNSVNKYPIFTDLAPSECLQRDIYYLETAAFNSSDQKQFVCGYKRNSLFNLPFSCYLNCQCCLTENCLCQHKVTESCLFTFRYDLTELRVDCKNGNLTDGTGIPHNATFIDLSANDLGYLTNETFRRQTMAEILYLNHSKITGIGERTFITFNTLMALHLEYNDIRILDSSGLLGLRKLKKLILNHNTIERILPGTFNVAPSLEELDLSHNNLRKIDSQTFNVDSLKTIVLFENPWSCACEDIHTLSRFLINRFSQIVSQNIICNQSEIQIFQYDINLCRNKSSSGILQELPTQGPTAVYGSSIGLLLILLIFIFGAFLYVHRKEIQILLFVRFGWRILSKKNQLDEEDKTYDAFVSYHNSQDAFVVNEMLPRLEEGTNPAYKLCVHFRDFPVGAPIVDNIIDSIENSKRTIILLTNQFLTSEWCRYEFKAAHVDSLSNKMNSLVLVLLEDVDPDLVDGELKLYMKTKTYLRYDDPRFWDKLRFALPERKEETKL